MTSNKTNRGLFKIIIVLRILILVTKIICSKIMLFKTILIICKINNNKIKICLDKIINYYKIKISLLRINLNIKCK